MGQFIDYINNIAMMLIFVSFTGMILPEEKYKKYINLIIGIIIIIVITGPILELFSKRNLKAEDIMKSMELSINKSMMAKESGFYKEEELVLVLDVYKESIYGQLETIIRNEGYEIRDYNIEISRSEDSFGEIEDIYMALSPLKEKEKKEKLIKIEKIEIKPGLSLNNFKSSDFSAIEEEEEIKSIKNYILSFYNLSVDNIHIIVSKE